MQKNKRMLAMIIGLTLIFGGIITFNFIKNILIKHFFAQYASPAVTVSSVVAKKQLLSPTFSTVGNFVALNGVDVNGQVGGNVTAIHFKSGQMIKQGELLIDIDDSVEQATLKYDQADLNFQQLNYKRQADLVKKGATAASSVDEALAKWHEAQALVEKTQALINQKHITAPFTGQLGIRQINLGDYIVPGKTTIVTLQSMDPLLLEFYVPEQYLPLLKLQQPITFSIEQNPNLLFTGKIFAMNSKIDTDTHNIKIQAIVPNCPAEELNNPDKATLLKVKTVDNTKIISCKSQLNLLNNINQFNFLPGLFANINLTQPANDEVITLPTTAISYTLYGNSVFLIKSHKDPHGKEILSVKQIFVTTGEQHGNETVIKSGIHAGDVVVASGDLKLQDGTNIVINNDVLLNSKPSQNLSKG